MDMDFNDLLDSIIADYCSNPVDLLGIGDADRERIYLSNARASYARTIRDIVSIFYKPQCDLSRIKILEIGSYLGPVSICLAKIGFSVTASDIPEYMGNQELQRKFCSNGITSLPLNLRDYNIPSPSKSFDLVIMCETLEHLNFNPLPALLEINRILRDGGHFYLSLPNITSLINRMKLACGYSIHNPIADYFAQLKKDDNMIVGLHWREYTKSETVEMLQKMGFDISKHYYFRSNKSYFFYSFIFKLFPSLLPNQTIVAKKKTSPHFTFHVSDAVK